MAKKRVVAKKTIDERYWRNVDIQDAFWRGIFVDFIRPFQSLYRDPISAGAHVLSAYLSDPVAAAQQFTENPAAFGSLNDDPRLFNAYETYSELIAGLRGPTLQQCAEQFEEQRAAGIEIDRFAAEYPALYSELQNERAVRNAKRTHVRVQFFGKSICVEQRIRPKKSGCTK